MTTKNFSAIKLPYPNYSIEVGYLDLEQTDHNLSKWIPRYSELAQVVEVRRCGSIDPGDSALIANRLIGSYVVIRDVRPELFLRRDFIADFVDTGRVHLVQGIPDTTNHYDGSTAGYQIATHNNVLTMTLNERQYRRFGMIAKRVISNKISGKTYRVEVDLKDVRIKKSNKYQDKLVQTFRRLGSLARLYFRYEPNESMNVDECLANKKSLAFFNFVINEYALDGHQPVPIGSCSLLDRELERKWLNCSQLHPSLRLECLRPDKLAVQRDEDLLGNLTNIIDWLGYQLLSLDCERSEIRCRYPDDQERLDVACAQVRGIMDYEQVDGKLRDLFESDTSDGAGVLRALVLYQCPASENSVVLLQDRGSGPEAASLITVIGMSRDGSAGL